MAQGMRTVATPENLEKFLAAIRLGVSRKAACHAAGISTSVLSRWTREAEAVEAKLEEDETYLPTPTEELRMTWILSLRAAEAEMEQKAIVHWSSFFDKDWKAAQSYLALRFREDWGQKSPGAEPEGAGTANLTGAVSVHVYLPDNNRSAAAIEDLQPEILEIAATSVEIDAPLPDVDPLEI